MSTNGKMICDRCNGLGAVRVRLTNHIHYCDKCRGIKQINWIENIFGVPRDRNTEADIIIRGNVLEQYEAHEKGILVQNYVVVDDYVNR